MEQQTESIKILVVGKDLTKEASFTKFINQNLKKNDSLNILVRNKFSFEYFVGIKEQDITIKSFKVDLLLLFKNNRHITGADIIVYLDDAPYEKKLLQSLCKKAPIGIDFYSKKNFMDDLEQALQIMALRDRMLMLKFAHIHDKNSQFAVLDHEIISNINFFQYQLSYPINFFKSVQNSPMSKQDSKSKTKRLCAIQ